MFKSNVVFTVYRRLVLEILYSLHQCEFVICNKYFNSLCVFLLLCTSMCVCEKEREREREREEREREREREREITHTHTHTHRRENISKLYLLRHNTLSVLSIIQTAFYVLEAMAQNE